MAAGLSPPPPPHLAYGRPIGVVALAVAAQGAVGAQPVCRLKQLFVEDVGLVDLGVLCARWAQRRGEMLSAWLII